MLSHFQNFGTEVSVLVPTVINCEIHNKKLAIQIQGVEFERCACSNRIIDNTIALWEM